MTIEEFMPTLSQNTQDIINKYLPNFSKPVLVFYSNESKMKVTETYNIYIKNQNSNYIDDKFLHEFFHCVQCEENFPCLMAINSNNNEMATSLNSLILDLNIRERLIDNGYVSCIDDVQLAVNKCSEMLEKICLYKIKSISENEFNLFDISGIVFTAKILNIKTSHLIKLIKRTFPKILDELTLLNNSIDLYSYNTAEGVALIFEYLIRALNLPFYINYRNQVEDE